MQIIDMTDMNHIQSDAIRQCMEFACKNDLQAIPMGRHKIDGDDIYVAINEYQTRPSEEKEWEAHREYIDLQVMIQGKEYIEVSHIDTMKSGEYVPLNDFLPCEGEAQIRVHMKQNVGLLLFPEDAHKPGVTFEKEIDVKKAVFKIHCSRWKEK